MAKPRVAREKIFVFLSWLVALTVTALVSILLGFLAWRSFPAWSSELFFGDTPPWEALRGAPVFDGLWPACLGTLALVICSITLAIPLGVATGIYFAEYATGRIKNLFSFSIDLLASVPSIVMGLFGFTLILLLRKSFAPAANTGLLLSAICLAVLVLPYVISTTRQAIESLPIELRLSGSALGLSRNQVLGHILLPAAVPGIFSGCVLALGRAAEDTAVILLTGVVANAGAPSSLTGKYEALPFQIYYLAAQYQTPDELSQAFAAALMLLAMTSLSLGLASRLRTRFEKKWKTGISH